MIPIILIAIITNAQSYSFSDIRKSFPIWLEFKDRFNKTYENKTEEWNRFLVFTENKNYIEKVNQKYKPGNTTLYLKINEFGDLSISEQQAFLGLAKGNVLASPSNSFHTGGLHAQLPNEVDWRTEGMVTEVQKQWSCGSCWAFSATGALEAQQKRKNGHLVALSQQQLIDCAKGYGANGCDGGLMTQAFKYISENQGIATADSYPYEGKSRHCRFEGSTIGATVQSYVGVPTGREDILQDAVARIGPILAGIDASQPSFTFYSGGIYEENSCSSYSLNHAVLIVGYNTTTDGQQYWLVKNSFGSAWGENGYFKLTRNNGNHCGIATMASYPTV